MFFVLLWIKHFMTSKSLRTGNRFLPEWPVRENCANESCNWPVVTWTNAINLRSLWCRAWCPQNTILHVVINNSKTVWPTKISIGAIFESDLSNNLLQDITMLFFKEKKKRKEKRRSLDNFEIAHKTCSTLIGVQFPLNVIFRSPL